MYIYIYICVYIFIYNIYSNNLPLRYLFSVHHSRATPRWTSSPSRSFFNYYHLLVYYRVGAKLCIGAPSSTTNIYLYTTPRVRNSV